MKAKKTVKKVTKKTIKVSKFDRHAHIECEHKLKHCKHCDTAYCSKCNMEWKKQSWNWTSASTSGTNQYLCGTQGTTATVKGISAGGLALNTGNAISTTTAQSGSTEAVINHKKH